MMQLLYILKTYMHPTRSTLFPYTTLFRSRQGVVAESDEDKPGIILDYDGNQNDDTEPRPSQVLLQLEVLISRDRKSTRLNSSHPSISYAVFCLKKKKYLHTSHR